MIAICWQTTEEVASGSSWLAFSFRIDSNPFASRVLPMISFHMSMHVWVKPQHRGVTPNGLDLSPWHSCTHQIIGEYLWETEKIVLSSCDSLVPLNDMNFQLLFVMSDNEIISDALETCACSKKKRKTCLATCSAFSSFSMPLLNIFFIDTQRWLLLLSSSRIESIFRSVRFRIVFSVVNSIITLDRILIEKSKTDFQWTYANITDFSLLSRPTDRVGCFHGSLFGKATSPLFVSLADCRRHRSHSITRRDRASLRRSAHVYTRLAKRARA